MKSRTVSKAAPTQSLDRNSRYHRQFALLAAMQAEQVLPIFEGERPRDGRPRQALEAIRAWAQGKRQLSLAEVRKLSLGSHAAARAAQTAAARFAARAAGHAVATWHVPTHAMGVPIYACKAILASQNKSAKDPTQGPSGPPGLKTPANRLRL